jgi:hypothetical protein
MFCFECIYWSKKEQKCMLNCALCLADRVVEEENK